MTGLPLLHDLLDLVDVDEFFVARAEFFVAVAADLLPPPAVDIIPREEAFVAAAADFLLPPAFAILITIL